MFQEGNYNVIEFYPPAQGMNQNISPDILPSDFAVTLENFIPNPVGLLSSRFGTSLIGQVPNAEKNIIEAFPYITLGDTEQILLYVQEYAQDTTASNFNLVNGDRYSFTFETQNSARYVKDTPIKIQYTLNGITIVYDAINSIDINGNIVTVKVLNNSFPLSSSGVVINQVSYSTGTIYSYEVDTNALSNPLATNLSVGCVPRSETYLNILIIYNGVDKIMKWNGATLTTMYEFVKQTCTGITLNSSTSVSFVVSDESKFNANNFQVGNLIQFARRLVNGNANLTTRTITNYNRTANLVTILVDSPLLTNARILDVFYQAFPPPFNYIKAINDRLWALAPGAVSLEYRNPGQEMLVFYSYQPNTLSGWFNEIKQEVPSFNISSHHGITDNLEAISFINGYMVFAGRERTQFWAGTDPGTSGQSSIVPIRGILLSFSSIVNTGVVHGNLIAELPNDVFFITKNGLQSVSSFNIAKQFAATSYNAVDPIIKENLQSIYSSNINYRACRTFKYDGANLAGFKIGNNKVLASLFSTSLYAWTFLSGDFLRSNTFTSLGNALYLTINNKIYKYADGNDGSLPMYGDQNGESVFRCRWIPSYPQLKGLRFANKRYELQMDYPSTFYLRPENQILITVNGDLPKSYQLTEKCRFDLRGDAFNTIPFTTDIHPDANSIGFRFAQPFSFFKDRLKFLASRFSIGLDLYVKDGPIVIRKLKLYGIIERR